jgi:hypothetical protein
MLTQHGVATGDDVYTYVVHSARPLVYSVIVQTYVVLKYTVQVH